MKKKIWAFLLAFCVILAGAGSIPALAADDVAPYDPVSVIIPFEKTWDDENDTDGMRPDEINITLYRFRGDSYTEADAYLTATVKATDDWKYNFVIPDTNWGDIFYREGDSYKTYNFAVAEDPITGYTEVLPEHKDPQIILEATQDYWDRHEPNNERHMTIDTEGPTKNFIAVKATKGKGYFIWTPEELSLIEQHILQEFVKTHPAFNSANWGKTTFLTGYGYHSVIGFTVSETYIEFDAHSDWAMWAAGEYTRSTIEENSCAITNLHTPGTVHVDVEKVWADGDNADGIRPASVTVQLYAGDAPVEGSAVTLGGDAGWTYTWTDLPATAAYSVVEDTSDTTIFTGNPETGYVPAYTSETDEDGNYSITVKNTHTPSPHYTSVPVKKVWDDEDDQDGIRPTSVKVQLYKDNEPVPDMIGTLDAAGDWAYSFTGLEEGPTYSVKEVPDDVITGEDGPGTYKSTVEKEGDTFIITNIHTPEKVTVDVEKVWDDEEDTDGIRPESVTVQLFAELTPVENASLTLDEGNEWKGQWTGLPKYANGSEIKYTVEEELTDVITGEDGPGTYLDIVENKKDGETVIFTSIIVTNTHTPEEKTEATVKKVWDDNDNKDKKRPAELTVTLSDGTKVTLNEENNWTATIKDLPANDESGEKIEYTWTEDKMPEGYKLADTKVDGTVTTLTNKYTPKEEVVTGDPRSILPYLIGMLASGLILLNIQLVLTGRWMRGRRK